MSSEIEPGTLATSGEGATSEDGPRLQPGDVVAGYRVEALAGIGGMGVVYRAVDLDLGRTVALKVIGGDRANDPRARELFVRESLTAAALEHPNVIPIYRAGEDAGRLYIAMRFVEGASLQELVDEGPLPAGRAARIVARVADALDAAHAKGLVHRDVKPANILVADPDGEEHVYLTDFGIATSASREAGRWAGTLSYLAPEQIRGEPLDGRADVYALGCVLFHALTGRPPFAVSDEVAAFDAHVNTPPPRVADVADDVPPGLEDVIARALAKRPEDRFQTAGELGRAALGARFDVALAAHDDDRAVAEQVAAELRQRGLSVVLATGPAAREAVRSASGCVALVGRSGLGAWAREPLAAAYAIAERDRAFRIVAALLPGGPDPLDPELAFLGTRPWADLRGGVADGIEDLLRALRGAAPARLGETVSDVCPYRGLEAFDEEHAADFFGREGEVARVVERLRTARFLAIVGPSGSGKSSLARAGVIPALRRGGLSGGERWRTLDLAPGAAPLAALTARLGELGGSGAGASPTASDLAASHAALDIALATALDGRPDDERVLVLVDQLEELFTLTGDPAERRAFLANLGYAATIPGGRAVVIVTLRADFYHRLAEEPAFRTLVASHQLALGPMDAAGLRRAIEQPALRAGLELEPGLTRRILTDVGGRPGTLPLLEHLLYELWQRRNGRMLTLEAYGASGGVEGSLARRANAIYDGLSPERQAIARRVLLRLTQPGDGTEDTRRRATMRELVTNEQERAEVEAVVGALAEARLVTTGRDEPSGEPVVEVTHEALIRGWPELRSWIDEDREALRLHRRLTEATRDWDGAGRDEGLLFRGTRLAAWDDRDLSALNDVERDFLGASRERAQRERDARQRRVKYTLAALAVAVAVVSGLAAFGFVQRDDASNQRDVAQSRNLAANARLQLDSDPELALLLARRAYAVDPTTQAEGILRTAAFESTVRASHRAHTGKVFDVAVNPKDGRIASAGEDGTVRLWDPVAGGEPLVLKGHEGEVKSVDFSPDGTALASAGADGTVRIWDMTGTQVRKLSIAKDGVNYVAYRPDGAALVTADPDGTARVIRARDGAVLRVLRGHQGAVNSAAFSPDGKRIVTTGDDYTVRIWSSSGTQERVFTGHTAPTLDAAFSPDGRRVASAAGDFTVRVWNLEVPTARPLVLRAAQTFGSSMVSWSRDGRRILSAGLDGTIRVWDSTGKPLVTLRGHEGRVYGAVFTPDATRIVSSGEDGSVRVWDWTHDLPTAQTTSATDLPVDGGATFSPDGATILSIDITGAVRSWRPGAPSLTPLVPEEVPAGDFARVGEISRDGRLVATARLDGTVVVRNIASPTSRQILRGKQASVWALGFSPDDRLLAAGGDDGTTNVWDLHTGKARTFSGHSGFVNAARFNADGSLLVTGSDDKTVRVWNVADGSTRAVLTGHTGAVLDASISPDGRFVASGSADRSARVWNVATGTFTPLTGHQNAVYTAVFDRSGTRLLTVADDGIKVWDPVRATNLLDIPAPARDTYKAAFSPDGTQIVVQTYSGAIRTYPCETCGSIGDVLDLASERSTRPLTQQEQTNFLTGAP
jgi:WD40 repeat protein